MTKTNQRMAVKLPLDCVISLRMTGIRKVEIQRMAAANSIPTSAMINVLINEAIQHRKKRV